MLLSNLVASKQYDDPPAGWEDPALPDIYVISEIGRKTGYAIGVHGSLKRDFDLIAVPWVDEAVGSSELISCLCECLNAKQVGDIEIKSHRRIAVILQIDGWFKPIDLSIYR